MKNITEDYQLATLRARFAARGYQPLNRRRIAREDLALWGFVSLACIVPAIAAAMFILL